MDDVKWERSAGAGGIAFVLLVLVSAFLPGEPPMTDDPAREIATYFADHDDAIRHAAFLGILATIPLVWWGAAVYRMLERATGNARLSVMVAVGIAVGAVAAGVSSVIYATVAIVGVEGTGGADGMRFFYLLGSNLNGVIAIGTAIAVGAVSAGILRTGVLPKALGWFGALVALLSVVASYGAVSTRDAVLAAMFASFLLFALWLVIVSFFMLRGPRPVVASAVP